MKPDQQDMKTQKEAWKQNTNMNTNKNKHMETNNDT